MEGLDFPNVITPTVRLSSRPKPWPSPPETVS